MKKGNQLFRAAMSFLFFLLLIFFIVSCTPVIPEITGNVYGIVAEPIMEARDIIGYTPISGATVSITDTSGITHTTITDADGYYYFAEIEVLPNTVINIINKSATGMKTFKDIVPKAVFPEDSYDAGIADAFSTARALVIESLVKLGEPQSQINLEEIAGTNGFDWLVDEIEESQHKEEDFRDNLNILNQSDIIASLIVNPPTSGPNLSSAKSIIHYKFLSDSNDVLQADIYGNIDNDSYTIHLTVPYDTDLTTLIADFTVSEKATAKVEDIIQQSNITSNNFTEPVTYTLVAEDGSKQDWIIIVDEELGPLNYFTINGCQDSTIAGETFSSEITMTAYDARNRIKTDYIGTISFASTDAKAILPVNYTFTKENKGTYTLPGSSIVLKTSGVQTISINDNDICLTSSDIAVSPAAKKNLVWVTQPPVNVVAGEKWNSFSIEITDIYGNRTNANDSVTIQATYNTSKNAINKITDDTNLSEGIKTVNAIDGLATFDDVIATKQGTVTLIGTAEGLEDTTVSNEVNISAHDLDHIVITPENSPIAAGQIQTYQAEAFDIHNNSLGDVTEETEFSIDAAAAGVWNGPIYQSEIAGIWTVNGTYNGKNDTAELTVNHGPLNRFNIKRIDDQTTGIPFSITIIAVDEYWNRVNTYNGINTLSSYTVTISPTSTESFTEGAWTGKVTITKDANSIMIITTGSGITSFSNAFDVLNTQP